MTRPARARHASPPPPGVSPPPPGSGTAPGGAAPAAAPQVDPRAVRVGVAPATRAEGDPTLTVSPAPVPVLRPTERLAGTAILGGASAPSPEVAATDGHGRAGAAQASDRGAGLLLDGRPLDARLVALDPEHVILVEGAVAGVSEGPLRTRLIFGPERRRDGDGAMLREVVVDGWRVEVEVEGERRAALRERARRGHDVAGKSGPIEVRAIIPGRIVALSVGPGDEVTAGQQLLVLEAMKMQNELRAPREGAIEQVPVAVGENVEVGDLLMVIT